MAKQAISVTLAAENLTWLKGRVGAGSSRSVSDLLDQIVTAARTSGRIAPSRSVAGTIEIDEADLGLDGADDAVRAMFDASLGRTVLVRQARAPYGAPRRAPRRRG
jgi:hypothetical protein